MRVTSSLPTSAFNIIIHFYHELHFVHIIAAITAEHNSTGEGDFQCDVDEILRISKPNLLFIGTVGDESVTDRFRCLSCLGNTTYHRCTAK